MAGSVGAALGSASTARDGNEIFSALDGPQAVDPTGATATDSALQAAMDAAATTGRTFLQEAYDDAVHVRLGRFFFIPDGEYRVDAPLRWPQGISIIMAPGAKLLAGVPMETVLTAGPDGRLQRCVLSGGMIDCNGLARSAVVLERFVAVRIEGLLVNDPRGHGVEFGDEGADKGSYELVLRDVSLFRPRRSAPPAGYAAVRLRWATDSVVQGVVARGFDVGVLTEEKSGNNTFRDVHVWNPTGSVGPSACFHDRADGSHYDHCTADSPSGYGWRISGDACVITAPRGFLNAGGVDNAATAFMIEGSPRVSIMGGSVRGSGGIRWKQDLAGDLSNVEWTGGFSDPASVVQRFRS